MSPILFFVVVHNHNIEIKIELEIIPADVANNADSSFNQKLSPR